MLVFLEPRRLKFSTSNYFISNNRVQYFAAKAPAPTGNSFSARSSLWWLLVRSRWQWEPWVHRPTGRGCSAPTERSSGRSSDAVHRERCSDAAGPSHAHAGLCPQSGRGELELQSVTSLSEEWGLQRLIKIMFWRLLNAKPSSMRFSLQATQNHGEVSRVLIDWRQWARWAQGQVKN